MTLLLTFNEDVQPHFKLSASPNIAVSGEVTTAQLNAPATKTTGDFTAGRIQDDENPADAVNILADDYTEMEWAIEATQHATDAQDYEFRLVRSDNSAFATYTFLPVWTIGTPIAELLLRRHFAYWTRM